MKKAFICLLALFVAAICNLQAKPITVRLKASSIPAGWGDVAIYHWGDETTTWPGEKLTEVDGWYSKTFKETTKSISIIFNNNDEGKQTVDIADVQSSTSYEISGGSGTKHTVSVIIESLSLTIGESGYATIYSDEKLTVPANVEVYGYSYDGFADALIPGNAIPSGSILPANTGFVVKAAAGDYTFDFSSSEAGPFTSDLSGYTSDKPLNEVPGTVFGLGQPSGQKMAFYKYSGTTIPAGKAIYVKSAK